MLYLLVGLMVISLVEIRWFRAVRTFCSLMCNSDDRDFLPMIHSPRFTTCPLYLLSSGFAISRRCRNTASVVWSVYHSHSVIFLCILIQPSIILHKKTPLSPPMVAVSVITHGVCCSLYFPSATWNDSYCSAAKYILS